MLTVIVSHGPSDNPMKRELEALLVRELVQAPGIGLLGVPHLYDLTAGSSEAARLREQPGDLVVLSWLYERAARWVLHALGVTVEGRMVHCFDLKTHGDGQLLLEELRRLARGQEPETGAIAEGRPSTEILSSPDEIRTGDLWSAVSAGSGDPRRTSDVPRPTLDVPRPTSEDLHQTTDIPAPSLESAAGSQLPPPRRWYPVIDYDRCTHCMECIDFCLFGVYGVDEADRILVEQPDQCRKGCPACSRVCPENAIMFPQHKTPAIAGAEGHVAALKMDLSALFSDPATAGDQQRLAAAERETHRRRTVSDNTRTRSVPSSPSAKDFDRLLDELEEFDQ